VPRGAGAAGTAATFLFFLPHPVAKKMQAAIADETKTARRALLTSSILHHPIRLAQLHW
jgi:hypothetical protein